MDLQDNSISKVETTVTTTGSETTDEEIQKSSGFTSFDWIIENYDNVISSDGEITSNVIHVNGTPNLKCFIQIAIVDGSNCSPRMKSGNYVHIKILTAQSESRSEKTMKIKLTIGVLRKKKLYLKNRCVLSRFQHYIDENDIKKALSSSGCLHLKLHIKQWKSEKKCATTADNDFQRYFLNENLSDVTFNVDNNNFPVHKVILASKSPVFETLFSDRMKENITNVVVINDINPDVFKEMLRFVYTGKIENAKNVAYDLHRVADKYEISSLRLICEQHLEHSLTPRNVISILEFSDYHNAVSLKQKCIDYIKKNIKEIGTMDSYKNLNRELLLELYFATNGLREQTS